MENTYSSPRSQGQVTGLYTSHVTLLDTRYFLKIHFNVTFVPAPRQVSVAYPGIFFGGRGGGSTNSVEDRAQRERGSGGGSPLVRGSGGSCNLVQEISFHIVKMFLIFGTLRLFMMTTNLFVIADVKQLRT